MDNEVIKALSFEQALQELETIVRSLEGGETSLEESIALYAKGQALKAHCETKLGDATARIEAIQKNDAGDAVATRPFDAERS
ncbi:exodeoxyribonuclease VII small subunit [Sandarakinorhabdus sp.]|uniref:exodeoxyribonuclease VII small subunit n=1 Tax=Sandarakinorhabdus sp. TaxID=1916663 RepID=UPI00286DB7EB|nr:exodeoxyribonuclease VII small subunit [Sandarakinorhabdus sp.]